MWIRELLWSACLLLTLHQGVHTVPVESNGTAPLKDDMTTEFAKQIIRRSKMAEIKAMLNTKIDPCTDFYTYACGNWHRNNPAQLFSNIMTDNFQVIAKAFDRKLMQVLESKATSSQLELKVQSFYQACKLVHRDDVHYKYALEKVYKEFGEFPLVVGNGWKDTEFNWWEMVAKIQHKYGTQIILALDIMGDVQNNTENKIYVGSPDYAQSSSSKILNALEQASSVLEMEKFFDIDKSLAKKTIKELSDFEHQLIQGGSNKRELGLKDLLTLKTIEELNKQYEKHINFTKFLEIILATELPDEVYIYDEQYLTDMFEAIERTPKRTLANYILWQLLQESLVDAGVEDMTKWCVEKTKKHFGKYIDHMVYARYRSSSIEDDVYQVWEDIRSTFRDQLQGDKFDWISNSTREKAIVKLEGMELHINAYDDENFEEMYKNLTIDRTNYVHNVMQILTLEHKRRLRKLYGQRATIEAPEILSFTPAYNILENNIKIPVALLQLHYFWDPNYPEALKYATLGYLVAHEMIHGFDDDGRNYDKDGNMLNWWDVKSTYEYESRRRCFQAQYHDYKYGGSKLPESVLQSENIADNGGVKLAYAAYLRWLKRQKTTNPDIEQQETLDGLAFNNKQLFFTGFAQIWCEDVQSLFKSTVVSADTHAPGMYRVIGSLSNFQEFSWVFNCSRNAPMDPEYKCAIY